MNSEVTLPIEGAIPTLALMYYDYSTELLKEINEDDIYIEMSAFESSIRRFYLVGELLNNSETAYKVAITLQSPQRYNYEVKVLMGELNPRLHDFSHASNVFLTSYDLVSNRFANAIPVDILLTSKQDTESIVILDIELDSIPIAMTPTPTPSISCVGATNTVKITVDLDYGVGAESIPPIG